MTMIKLICMFTALYSLGFACDAEAIPIPEPKVASYYADAFHGKLTASGYIYDMNQMTAASVDYPFGTVLRVTNRRNDNFVDVVVTDTGAFKKKYGRDIDLSKEAFKRLDKLGYGLLDVDIMVIDESKQFKYKHGGIRFDNRNYGI